MLEGSRGAPFTLVQASHGVSDFGTGISGLSDVFILWLKSSALFNFLSSAGQNLWTLACDFPQYWRTFSLSFFNIWDPAFALQVMTDVASCPSGV